MGIRTPDLLHAMQALYQLSYSPSRAVPTSERRHASVQDPEGSSVIGENRFGQGAGVVLDEPPLPGPPADD
jgi:hypothetical protein